ncbi:PIN domain-containing protein [Caenispirillum bisanense]|uniref:PIN domain-containing protein n=1 Tax=Caenispirillum bisanense TaxID=414052 RepID=A0A286GPK9_9PROT|nr:PIN domain-containing protein [Caenispirillum bisanense]SOD97116.1 PIN domain-containing protein [Caenispirillum bisanense]
MTAAQAVRCCLDLNVYCAALLARSRGRENTGALRMLDMMRDGRGACGPLQLIVSWVMLDRLRKVFVEDWRLPKEIADLFLADVRLLAALGPDRLDPYLLLGGGGVAPVRDEEDRSVLEVAGAARSALLVTSNFADFTADAEILVPQRLALAEIQQHRVIVARPAEALHLLTAPVVPDVAAARRLAERLVAAPPS